MLEDVKNFLKDHWVRTWDGFGLYGVSILMVNAGMCVKDLDRLIYLTWVKFIEIPQNFLKIKTTYSIVQNYGTLDSNTKNEWRLFIDGSTESLKASLRN